ncbi:MAG TPA: hypothetical protein VLW52_14240 [Opitutaceae bacterium]|nr:hypothetical protein [Opitutaceae bacterium]
MKVLYLLLGGVALLVVAALVVLTFFLGSIVKAGVNRYGPGFTKTKVELADARIFPLTGNGSIRGLVIGNPPGWRSDRAIYLGEARLSIAPLSLLRDHVVINEILIDQPEFVYETKIFSSNLQDLLKNMRAAAGPAPEATAIATARPSPPRRYEVKRIRLQNGKVRIALGSSSTSVPLPTLTLTDLGTKEGGLTARQLAEAVTRSVLEQVLATAAANGSKPAGSAAADATVDALKKAAEAVKGLFGGKK